MASSDPVSEFLAREQTALAEFGEDFVAPRETPPTQQMPLNNFEENGFLPSDDGPITNGTYGLDGSRQNSNANLDMAFMNSEGGMNEELRNFSNSRSQSTQPHEEPEKIRKWREQQKELIEKKDKEEEKKKEELRQQARKELEQFYAQRKAELEQRKKQNRERQSAHEKSSKPAEEKEAVGAPAWERVARMIEGSTGVGAVGLPGKVAKPTGQTSSALGKDTSRMKQLILLYARGEPQPSEKSPSPETA